MPTVTDAVRRAGDARSLVDLIAPLRCVECGRPRERVCGDCLSRVETCPERRVLVDARGPLEVWAGASYLGVVRSALLEFKRGGAKMIGAVLAQWGSRALAVWSCSSEDQVRLPVIPIHSGYETRRRAGLDVAAFLARASCRELSRHGHGPAFIDRLRTPRPAVVSQKSLLVAERFLNVTGSIRVRSGRVDSDGCVLFDDVVTTGASLLEARRVLADAGFQIRGAACVAAVPSWDSTRVPTSVSTRRARCPP